MKGEQAMKYLVVGSGGPGFASPKEAVKVLEEIILPSFLGGHRSPDICRQSSSRTEYGQRT